MKIADENNKKEIPMPESPTTKNKIIYISIFTLVLVIVEFLLRDYLKYLNSFFNIHDVSTCKYLAYFEFYELSGRYFLLFTVYNLVNVYAALSFIFLDSFGVFINGIIRFFYLDPRPFWEDPNLTPCFCAVDYGNPSTTGINLFLLFAVLYKSFTYNNNNTKRKVFFMTLGVLVVSYTFVIRIFQNVHYIHQLLYGLGIGYVFYYIYFDILEVNFDDKEQFQKVIDNPFTISLACVLLYIFSNVFHLSLNFGPQEQYITNISKHCPINPIFAFDNESYTKSTRIFEFLGYYMGVWLEYKIMFGKNYELFSRYNIKGNTDKEKFNETDLVLSSMRILTMFFLHIFFVSKLILSKYVTPPNENMFFSLAVRLIIPYFVEGIFLFFAVKALYKYVKLTNESLFAEDVEKGGYSLLEKDEEEKKISN